MRGYPARTGLTLLVCTVTMWSVGATDVRSQESRLDLDAGVSHARPPADIEADPATYMLLGGRFLAGSAFGSLYGGLGAESSAADWVGAVLGAAYQEQLGSRLQFGIGGYVTAFTLGDPTPYDAVTGRVFPELRWLAGSVPITLRLHGGVGRSDVTDFTSDPPEPVVSDLWLYGAGLETSQDLGDLQAWTGLEAYETAGGSYLTGYAGAGWSVGTTTWRATIQLWDTPDDLEAQFALNLSVPLASRWGLDMTGGRSGPNPLLNSPAGVDGSAVVSWNVLRPRPERGIVTLSRDGSTFASFRLERPGADSVSVMGDFSDWTPIPMRQEGKGWEVRVPVDAGVYHFGFLVDGEWYVPEDAPGRVTDEFGRVNATLAVPAQ